jgi:hypothetical protein
MAPREPFFARLMKCTLAEFTIFLKAIWRVGNYQIRGRIRKRSQELKRITEVNSVLNDHFARITMYW